MFMRPAIDEEPVRISPGMGFVLGLTGAATIGIGVFPNFFINLVNWSLTSGQSSSLAQILK
jgi:hypothetical protein